MKFFEIRVNCVHIFIVKANTFQDAIETAQKFVEERLPEFEKQNREIGGFRGIEIPDEDVEEHAKTCKIGFIN